MRSIPSGVAQTIKQEASTLCTCWEITRTDGVINRWTSHDEDLEINGELFSSAEKGGFDRTAIRHELSEVSDSEIRGFIGSVVDVRDIKTGAYDDAEIKIWAVDWESPSDGGVMLASGWIGEFKSINETQYQGEVRGFGARLNQTVGEYFSAHCRASFCDQRCKLKKENFIESREVLEVIDRANFEIVSPLTIDADFSQGVVKFASGETVEIFKIDETRLTLKFPIELKVEAGQTVKIMAGCAKDLEACKGYNNVINFRGEPHLPGESVLAVYK